MKLIAILHDIRSVHNVGSIFRTADAAGVSRIFLCGITPAPLDRFGEVRPDFAKVALGAEQSVEWEKVPTTLEAIRQLKAAGWKIFALEQAKDSVPYYEAATQVKEEDGIALVLGAEVEGLPREVLDAADAVIEIPMRGVKESLNVSVAFGVAAFRLRYNKEK